MQDTQSFFKTYFVDERNWWLRWWQTIKNGTFSLTWKLFVIKNKHNLKQLVYWNNSQALLELFSHCYALVRIKFSSRRSFIFYFVIKLQVHTNLLNYASLTGNTKHKRHDLNQLDVIQHAMTIPWLPDLRKQVLSPFSSKFYRVFWIFKDGKLPSKNHLKS